MGKKNLKVFLNYVLRISVIIFSIFVLTKIFSDFDLLNFSSLLTFSNVCLMIFAAVCLLSAVLIKSIRWKYLVNSQHMQANYKNTLIDFWNYQFSLILNLIIPFRMGEIYRILSSGGAKKSLVKNSYAVFVEKFFDLLVILGGLIIYLMIFGIELPKIFKEIFEKGTVLLTFLGIVILLFLYLMKQKFHFKKRFNLFRENFFFNIDIYFLIYIFFMTCLIWILEAVKFFVVWYCLGNSMTTTLPLLAFFVATLSLGIPGAPAGLGTFHYAVIVATIPFGIEYSDALNYAVLVHLSYFSVLVLCSFFLYLLIGLPTGLKEISFRGLITQVRSGRRL